MRERFCKRKTIHCLREGPSPNESQERIRFGPKREGDLVTVGGYESFDSRGYPIAKKKAK